MLQKNMSTFSCSLECEKFCSDAKCEQDAFWKNKIKSGRPEKWEIESEKTSKWTEEEKDQVTQILSRLPNELKNINLTGIYRMKKSVDIINPGTTSEDGHSIIFYDRAFGHTMWTTEEVLLHEIGHSVYAERSSADKHQYEEKLGWKKDNQGVYSKQGSFVSTRAQDNPVEDFAENFKYLLLNPDKLKNDNNQAYDWFNNFYKKQLKLKKECL